jgi:hypothetical protein
MLLLPLLVAPHCPATIVYDRPFSDPGALDDWPLSGATYEVADGWLTVRSEKSNPSAALKVRHDGDGTFRATVRNARECHWVAVLARGVYRLEVNNQFVELRLLRKLGDEWKLVAQVGGYELYPLNTQEFELRLTMQGGRVCGFIDRKKLIEYDDAEPVPPGGGYALMSGWGTNCAWRDVSLSDAPDLSEWPREGPPAKASTNLVEVTWVRGLHSDNVYFGGETAGLTYRLKNPGDAERRLALSLRLIDVWQRTVAEKPETAAFRAGEEREFTVQFAPPARGCLKVALYAGTSSADLGWVEDLGSFTVVPKALYDGRRNARSCFGGHMDGINLQWHLQAGRKIGIQWARCHDMLQQTWWRRIQPDGPDQWIWMDDTQATLDGLGFGTQGEFMWTPKWATSAPPAAPGNPETYPPKDWNDLARYVRETVTHYKGSIHVWEVWNEPHFSGFFSGTPEDYAKLLQVCYTEAKRADPECIVLGGGGPTVRQYDWIERVLKAGGGQWMDGFTMHYLEPDIADARVPKLRKLLDVHGMTGPIINSEENVPSTSFLDQCRVGCEEPEARYHFRNACFEFVRRYMMNLSNGVQRVFYYDQADPWRFRTFPKPRPQFPNGPIGGTMWDEGQAFRPLAAAHAALALAIEGKTFRQRIERGDLQAFIFEGNGSATAVQYATFPSFTRREEVRLPLPAGAKPSDFTTIDVMGNESPANVEDGKLVLLLAREPVYLVCRASDPVRMLRACYGG